MRVRGEAPGLDPVYGQFQRQIKHFRRCWEEREMVGLGQAPPGMYMCVHTLLLALGLPRQLDPLGLFSLGQWPVSLGIQELLLPVSPQSPQHLCQGIAWGIEESHTVHAHIL